MIVPFKQGVLTYGIRTPFIIKNNKITWHPDALVKATLSHGTAEYYLTITPTPITISHVGTTYWLIAEISENDATLSVYTTHLEQDFVYVDALPTTADDGAYRFVINDSIGYRYKSGQWVPTIRVKLAKVTNNVIDIYSATSQVNATAASTVDYTSHNVSSPIILNELDEPIKLFSSVDTFVFATEGQYYSSQIDTYTPGDYIPTAGEALPKYSLLEFDNDGRVVVCKKNSLRQCVGITLEDVAALDKVTPERHGFIKNSQWFFSSFGNPLFVNSNGFISTTIPDPLVDASIQRVGTVIDRDTILLDIDPIIIVNS